MDFGYILFSFGTGAIPIENWGNRQWRQRTTGGTEKRTRIGIPHSVGGHGHSGRWKLAESFVSARLDAIVQFVRAESRSHSSCRTATVSHVGSRERDEKEKLLCLIGGAEPIMENEVHLSTF